MPRSSKAQSFAEILAIRFPEAAELAFQRIFAGHSIFFDTKKHRALYAKDLIKAALWLAQYYAHQAGFCLLFSEAEKKILKNTFGPLLAICLLLSELYDYFQ